MYFNLKYQFRYFTSKAIHHVIMQLPEVAWFVFVT